MLTPGETFDRYEVESLLGEGGMGRVYRARDTKLDRRVALKVVRLGDPDGAREELRARLVREARAAAKLEHPNAVVVHDVGEVDGVPYIVMEYLAGDTLRAHVGDERVTLERKVAWLAAAARGLAHAHDRGIVHRDVKPENVMLTEDGRIKVLDFGIARRLGGAVDPTGPTASPALPTLTQGAAMLGTTRYMSPEQVRGLPLDGRSDQFSWGIMAYELVTGHPPFSAADALACAAAILTEDPPPLDGVPHAVASVILRALEKPPDRRFASMHALVSALEGGKGASLPPPPPDPLPAPARGPGGGDFRRYSSDQVGRILRRAVDLDREQQTGLGRGTLIDIAREVGVAPEAIDAAVRELDRPPPPSLPARPLPHGLRRHFAFWAVFSVFFFLVDMFSGGGFWFYWPMLGWGLGLALHAVGVLTAAPSRKRRRDSDDAEVRAGAELLLDSARRLRVAERKLRVDDDADADALAEELDELPPPSPAKRRAHRR